MIVQNRLSRALRLAGKLIHRWDKVEFNGITPAQETELRAAEEQQEVWCFPSLLQKLAAPPRPPEPALPPQQRVVLKPSKNHKR
jgi:hypothetical protein